MIERRDRISLPTNNNSRHVPAFQNIFSANEDCMGAYIKVDGKYFPVRPLKRQNEQALREDSHDK